MRKSYSNHINRLLKLDTLLQTVGDVDGEDEPVTFEIYASKLNKARRHSHYFNTLHDRMFELRTITDFNDRRTIRNFRQFAVSPKEAVDLFRKSHPKRIVLSIDGKELQHNDL